MSESAHVDTFARDNLPPREHWPEMLFTLPELRYAERINCAVELLDSRVSQGWGEHPAIYGDDGMVTYAELQARVNQVAHVLSDDMGLVPGNRLLLRGPNNAMLAICWLAAVKAGLIVVATMPLLREKELVDVIEKAQVGAAICDRRFADELIATQTSCPVLQTILFCNDDNANGLEARMAGKPTNFAAIDTAAEDVALIAFTSGSTGKPKATMHFHRDLLAICDCFPKSVVQTTAQDVHLGTPPLAFTFGLGGLLLFPLRAGGATVLLEKLTPESMLQAIEQYRATITWSTPMFYRQMAGLARRYDLASLRRSVSAGESLPISTRNLWQATTGIAIIDGIGSTEMLHIFIAAAGDAIRPGATGKPVPGYQACVVDEAGLPLPPGSIGRLGVKGPTGCRYLDDARQSVYVQNGWNVTGDAYRLDEDGYFWFQARTDDIILTAGYNVAGPEVENALLEHPAVAECAVVAVPDDERGNVIKAFIVLKPDFERTTATSDEDLAKALQEFVKQTIAPYKYPRVIEFCDRLPRADTGKLQRYKLRHQEQARSTT